MVKRNELIKVYRLKFIPYPSLASVIRYPAFCGDTCTRKENQLFDALIFCATNFIFSSFIFSSMEKSLEKSFYL